MSEFNQGDRIRIKFEYNYNSCNWGYIADFDVLASEYDDLIFHSKDFKFFKKEKPFEMNIHEWIKVPKEGERLYLNCTGNTAWCEPNTSIEEIIQWARTNGQLCEK